MPFKYIRLAPGATLCRFDEGPFTGTFKIDFDGDPFTRVVIGDPPVWVYGCPKLEKDERGAFIMWSIGGVSPVKINRSRWPIEPPPESPPAPKQPSPRRAPLHSAIKARGVPGSYIGMNAHAFAHAWRGHSPLERDDWLEEQLSHSCPSDSLFELDFDD